MRVLIAIDDEKYGSAAIDFLSKHIWPENTEFKLIHVVEPLLVGSYMSVFPSPVLEDITQEHIKYAQNLLLQLKEKISRDIPGHHVYSETIIEMPKSAILQQATDWKADLMVLGSHGRRGVSRFLLGSVAEAVTSHAPCSVVIVRLPAAEANKTEPLSTTAIFN
jgi:nucleotide-binding universal stress UspA family protein